MEVDVSYTGNLHRMRNGARGAPGRLEYIPTLARRPGRLCRRRPPPRPYEHSRPRLSPAFTSSDLSAPEAGLEFDGASRIFRPNRFLDSEN